MRKIICLVCLFGSFMLNAQSDTIVVHDYTKMMISTDQDGKISPLVSLRKTNQAGFFITEGTKGKLKICNNSALYIWVNGRLLDVIKECEIYDPTSLFLEQEKDTLYLSFYSDAGLSGLVFQQIVFKKLQVFKEHPKMLREVRNGLKEFTVIATVILMLSLGFASIRDKSRMRFLMNRTLTFKTGSYEFINTNFVSPSGITFVLLFSLLLGFLGIYFDQLLQLGFIEVGNSFSGLLYWWLKLGLGIFFLLIFKWVLTSVVSKLFHFREVHNYQLFDFINFSLSLLILIFLFAIFDFIINPQPLSWIGSDFILVFPGILILFVLWFSLKFVNNSPRNKLVIISYLCATEIIPAILIFG